MDDQPFTAVESEELQNLFKLLNPAVVIPSADTIKNSIMDKYRINRTNVHDILKVCI